MAFGKVFSNLGSSFNRLRQGAGQLIKRAPGLVRDALAIGGRGVKTLQDVSSKFDKTYQVAKELLPEEARSKVEQGINKKNTLVSKAGQLNETLQRVLPNILSTIQ